MKWIAEIIRLIFAGLADRAIAPVVTDQAESEPEFPEDMDGLNVDLVVTHEPAETPEATDWGTAQPIVDAMLAMGYEVFEKDDRDLNLNIVGVRDPDAVLDEFRCELHCFWRYQGKVTHLTWKATTYPGSRYLIEKLLNPRGAAILVPNQYRGIYKMDLHGGRYRALCQRLGPVEVYRDGDRDRKLEMNPSTIMSGYFGINVHAPVTVRAGMRQFIANRVYAASAGCQVFQSLADFLEFRSLCDRAAEIYGNRFTYTLITRLDLGSEPAPEPDTKQYDRLEDWNPNPDTLGIRRKNLLNVKGSDKWLYSEGRDDRGHHAFPTFAKGLRAGVINLRSYWVRHRLRTIASILSRWAPVTDTIGSLPGAAPNSPRDYSIFVSRRMGGYSPHAPLDLFTEKGEVKDADQLFEIVSAMAAYENRANLKLPRAVFDEALSLL